MELVKPAEEPDDCDDGLEELLPVAETLIMLIALGGRTKGFGDARPPEPGPDKLGELMSEDGCCLTKKTKVLFAVRRAHCGWTT